MLFRNKETVKQTGVKTAPAYIADVIRKVGRGGNLWGHLYMTAVYAKLISPTTNKLISLARVYCCRKCRT